MSMSREQANTFRHALLHRYQDLREEIRRGLLASDDEHYIDLAGRVHDLEDESVADLLVDIQLASIDRDLDELRRVDAALLRIARGDYGDCEDCGGEIDVERLQAQPAASRCEDCQRRHEKRYAGPRRSSL